MLEMVLKPVAGSTTSKWLSDRWFITAACFLIYLATLPPAITFEDAGEISLLCVAASPIHPPGYPLYSLACAIASQVSLLDPFKILCLISALSTAGAVWVLHGLLVRIASRMAAVVSAFVFGTSLAVWSQAIIPEVYGPNLLAFLFIMISSVRLAERPQLSRALLLGLATGLALSLHWPLIVLAGISILIFSLKPLGGIYQAHGLTKLSASLAAGLFLGLSPYIWLAIRLPAEGFSFLGPLYEFQDWIGYVLRRNYVDDNPGANIEDHISYLSWIFSESSRQFGLICLPLIIVGLWRSGQLLSRVSYWALVWLFLSQTIILSLLLDFNYDFFFKSIFQPYPLIGYSVLAIWLALGLDWIGGYFDLRGKTIIFLMIALSVPTLNLAENNRRNDTIAREYGAMLLNSVPENGILMVNDDFDTGPAGYLHYLEKLRPDVSLFQDRGLVFPNRLLTSNDRKTGNNSGLIQFLAQQKNPVMTTAFLTELPEDTYLQQRGLVWQLKKGTTGESWCDPIPEHIDFVTGLLNREGYHHPHVKKFINSAVTLMTRCLLNARENTQFNLALDRLSQHPSGALLVLERLLSQTSSMKNDELIYLTSRTLEQKLDTLIKENQAAAHMLLAFVLLRPIPGDTGITKKALELAEQHLWRSIKQLPASATPGRQLLYYLYRQTERLPQASDLVDRFSHDKELARFASIYPVTNHPQSMTLRFPGNTGHSTNITIKALNIAGK